MVPIGPIFRSFIILAKQEYRLEDQTLYVKGRPTSNERHCINPVLSTESDVEMRFGSYLQSRLMNAGLVVHSQMRVYPGEKQRAVADLTIHQVKPDTVWSAAEDVNGSLVAAIEVKYANCRQPHFDFSRGYVKKDLDNLSLLGRSIAKYLIILDEAGLISEHIDETLDAAQRNYISVLSNNRRLMYINPKSP